MKPYSELREETQSYFILSNFFPEKQPIPYDDFYPGKDGTITYHHDVGNGSLIFQFTRLLCTKDSCSDYNANYYPSYDLYLYCSDQPDVLEGYTLLPRCDTATSFVYHNIRPEDMNEEIRIEFRKENLNDLKRKCNNRFYAYLDASLIKTSEQGVREATIPFAYKTTFVNIFNTEQQPTGRSKSIYVVLFVFAVILCVFAFVYYRRWKANERRLINATTVVREVTMSDMGYERAPQSPNDSRSVDIQND